MANAFIKSPFGAGTEVTMTATGAQAFTINDEFTLVDGVTVEATAARTLNLTLNSELAAGARLLVISKTNATETLTFGTGITSAVITGVTGKTMSQAFTFNGTAFMPDGAKQQID